MLRLIALCAAVLSSLAFAEVPFKFGYHGRVLKADGTPMTGVVELSFKLFDGTYEVWDETQNVGLTDGYYEVQLGDVAALDPAVFAGHALELEMSVNGSVLSPRHRLTSVPYSMACLNLAGGAVNASTISVGGKQVINTSGNWVGPVPVSVGAGVSGNGSIESPLAINYTTVQRAIKPAADAAPGQLCPAGLAVGGVAADGTATCGATMGSLRGLWLFDETSGLTAADSSGSGNTGALIGGTFTWDSGPNSNALNLMGKGEMVAPASASLAMTGELTLEAWVNLAGNATGNNAVVGREGAWRMSVDSVSTGGGTLSCTFVAASGSTLTVAAGTVPLATWVHLACTYDGSYVRAYVNDVLFASASNPKGALALSAGPLRIGGRGSPLKEYFSGRIDEVRITALAKSFGGGSNGVPVGTIIASMLSEAQIRSSYGPGWVLADGRNVDGSRYTEITGSKVLPDLRGQFLRGRNNGRADGNENPDGDLNVGVYQADGLAQHGHSVTDPGHSHLTPTYNAVPNGNNFEVGAGAWDGYDYSPEVPVKASMTGISIGQTSATGNRVGVENRPRNVTVNYFIRIN